MLRRSAALVLPVPRALPLFVATATLIGCIAGVVTPTLIGCRWRHRLINYSSGYSYHCDDVTHHAHTACYLWLLLLLLTGWGVIGAGCALEEGCGKGVEIAIHSLLSMVVWLWLTGGVWVGPNALFSDGDYIGHVTPAHRDSTVKHHIVSSLISITSLTVISHFFVLLLVCATCGYWF